MQTICLLADYANVTGDGKLNVIGVFNQINALRFPARHVQMYVVIKIISEIGETSESRHFALKLLDEDNHELGRVEGNFNFPEASGGIRPEANIILPINDLVFPSAGMYEFVFLVDNHSVAHQAIVVNQITPSEE